MNRTSRFTAEAKNAWCCTPPSGFTALCLSARGDKPTVTPKSDPSQTAANPALYTSIRHEELPELPQTDAVCLKRQRKRRSTGLGPPAAWWINPLYWLENTVLRNPVTYKLQNGTADCKRNYTDMMGGEMKNVSVSYSCCFSGLLGLWWPYWKTDHCYQRQKWK